MNTPEIGFPSAAHSLPLLIEDSGDGIARITLLDDQGQTLITRFESFDVIHRAQFDLLTHLWEEMSRELTMRGLVQFWPGLDMKL